MMIRTGAMIALCASFLALSAAFGAEDDSTAPTVVAAWEANYPEGPVWIGGVLYWAEMGADRVMAWNDGTPEVFFQEPGCGPTAIARYRNRDFIVLCHLSGKVAQLNGDGRLVRKFSADRSNHRLRNPNDAAADGNGGVWFTDPGVFSARAEPEGALLHLDPLGKITRHVTELAYGNGVHVDEANRRLLVSEHLGQKVLAYPLTDQGLGDPVTVLDFQNSGLLRSGYAEAGPDGLEIDGRGRLWIALYGEGMFAILDGNRVATQPVETAYLTNIAFSGDGRMALTGAFDNARAPFPGRVIVAEVP